MKRVLFSWIAMMGLMTAGAQSDWLIRPPETHATAALRQNGKDLVLGNGAAQGGHDQMAVQHGLYVETNYRLSDHTNHWKPDSSYTSQVDYGLQTPCLLEVYPDRGPDVILSPGDSFRSIRTAELLIDAYDRERRGLSIRRMYRVLVPWTTENPLFMHLVSKNDDEVRRAFAVQLQEDRRCRRRDRPGDGQAGCCGGFWCGALSRQPLGA